MEGLVFIECAILKAVQDRTRPSQVEHLNLADFR